MQIEINDNLSLWENCNSVIVSCFIISRLMNFAAPENDILAPDQSHVVAATRGAKNNFDKSKTDINMLTTYIKNWNKFDNIE